MSKAKALISFMKIRKNVLKKFIYKLNCIDIYINFVYNKNVRLPKSG